MSARLAAAASPGVRGPTMMPPRRRFAAALVAIATLAAGCGGRAATEPAPAVDDDGLVTRLAVPMVDRSRAPGAGAPRAFQLPALDDAALANGMRVVVARRPGFPTVSLRLVIEAGGALPGASLAAWELIERTLRDGAGDLDADAIAERIDANGLAFSVDVDAEATTLSIDGLAAQWPTMLALAADLVQRPHFPEERIEVRRRTYLGELAVERARPEFHVEEQLRRLMFGDDPRAQYAPSAADLAAVERDALVAQWQDFAGPAVATLIVVGDVPDDAPAAAAGAFANWRGGPATRPATLGPPPDVEPRAVVVVRPNSAQTAVLAVGPGVTVGDPAYFDALVANHVLGGGPSSRLFMNLREDKSYTYGTYSRLNHYQGFGLFRAFANVRSEVTGEALQELLAELGRWPDNLSEQAADARAYLGGNFAVGLQTNAQVASNLAWLTALRVPYDYLERYRDAVDGVADADVAAAARALAPARPGAPPGLSLVLVGEAAVAIPAAEAVFDRVEIIELGAAAQ